MKANGITEAYQRGAMRFFCFRLFFFLCADDGAHAVAALFLFPHANHGGSSIASLLRWVAVLLCSSSFPLSFTP
jgi:hypothetical protein